MNKIKYLVTNPGNTGICLTGRIRVEIPAKCADLPLELPENHAAEVLARLKHRYPLLRFAEVKEDSGQASAPEIVPPDNSGSEAPQAENATARNAHGRRRKGEQENTSAPEAGTPDSEATPVSEAGTPDSEAARHEEA